MKAKTASAYYLVCVVVESQKLAGDKIHETKFYGQPDLQTARINAFTCFHKKTIQSCNQAGKLSTSIWFVNDEGDYNLIFKLGGVDMWDGLLKESEYYVLHNEPMGKIIASDPALDHSIRPTKMPLNKLRQLKIDLHRKHLSQMPKFSGESLVFG